MKAQTDSFDWLVDDASAVWGERIARPGYRGPSASFDGRRVLSLETRRAPELALLVMNYGGRPVVAPALREVALESNPAALAFGDALIRETFDVVVLMTGVGTRLLVKIIEPVHGRDAFIHALASTRIVARGQKPVAALRELGLTPWATVPRPNTWREVLTTFDAHAADVPLPGLCVAVQAYGAPNPDLTLGIEARGARVTDVPVYQWALPDDVAPIRAAVSALVAAAIDVVLLTAPVQLVHLLAVAADMGLEAAVRRALPQMIIASIGPMTSEEIVQQGLQVDLEPSNAKMGVLVKEAAEQCASLLHAKRRSVAAR